MYFYSILESKAIMSSTHPSFQLQVTKVITTITRHTIHPEMLTEPATRSPTPVSLSTAAPSQTEPVKIPNHV